MTDEHFLARWSRRKREASADQAVRTTANAQPPVREATEPGPSTSDRAPGAAPRPSPAAFDPAKLPPLESITDATDLRPFMAPGVPTALTREALRRAWSIDPAIRDFAGLQEYDFDFHTPGAIAGFGELGGDVDVKRMAARILGEDIDEGRPDTAADSSPARDGQAERDEETTPADDRLANVEELQSPQDDDVVIPASGTVELSRPPDFGSSSSELVQRTQDTAMHNEARPHNNRRNTRRSHGGALPQS